jgi:hypothetical protein
MVFSGMESVDLNATGFFGKNAFYFVKDPSQR